MYPTVCTAYGSFGRGLPRWAGVSRKKELIDRHDLGLHLNSTQTINWR